MSWIANHAILMVAYALLTAAFFSLLWKTGSRERLRFFAVVFFSLVLGALAIAWAMYPFPG